MLRDVFIAKSTRTALNMESTRPKTVEKLQADLADMESLAPRITRESLVAAALRFYPPEKVVRIRANLVKVGGMSSLVAPLVHGFAA